MMQLWLAKPTIPDIKPDKVVNSLFPNWLVLITHVIAAIVLILLLTKWLYGPTKRNLQRRRQLIQTRIDRARQQELKAVTHERQAKKKLLTVNRQRHLIMEQAIVAAEKRKDQIIGAAVKEVQLMRAKAQALIADEQRNTAEAVRTQIIRTAFAASQAVLGHHISPQQHQMLVEKFINDL